ncbi:hypothetical protein D3C77_628370 [compost metagenome]
MLQIDIENNRTTKNKPTIAVIFVVSLSQIVFHLAVTGIPLCLIFTIRLIPNNKAKRLPVITVRIRGIAMNIIHLGA